MRLGGLVELDLGPIVDQVPITVVGGLESISLTGREMRNQSHAQNGWPLSNKLSICDPMLDTAEVVAAAGLFEVAS